MKYSHILLILLTFQTVGAQQKKVETSKEFSFDRALIYQYTYPDSEGEFWVYHHENGTILYVPQDEMIDFVIADTLGNYYTFGDNGHGEKVVTSQRIQNLSDRINEMNPELPLSNEFLEITPLSFERIVDQKDALLSEIKSVGYELIYQKMAGQQHVFVTDQILVNANLLYGLTRIEGDVQLKVPDFYFAGIFNPDQLVTHIERDNFILKLISYEYNPYLVDLSVYNYYIQDEQGNWMKTPLPF
ncbi:hypothetical protein [Moheibacter lacus]|uniref:WG containing repeat-containing protein n=1 Tax=Moheibacter lacus TaxID=2745851 RepID=A0A838ZTT8_9FLAO|nr:hypothetical protein [Moheibacter lacus]MBA5630410.1 hypothetical protein [Moheibacter lacus]